jgi:cytoskeletal protein CcmA (bactofilin family)
LSLLCGQKGFELIMFNWTKSFITGGNGGSSNLVKINTLIGEGTVFNGNIELTSSIKIDGIVNGNITTSADVIIEETATIYGEICAECVLISGTTTGNIYARDQITITSTARVKGDVITPGFIVDVGSEFIGKCEIIDRDVIKRTEFLVSGEENEVDRTNVTLFPLESGAPVDQAYALKEAMIQAAAKQQVEALVGAE